jgi:diguanylate cyclase
MPPVKQVWAVSMKNDMRASLWRIYLATGTAMVAGYFLLPDDWWQTGTGAAIALAAAASLLVGVRMYRPHRPGLWWMLATGLWVHRRR